MLKSFHIENAKACVLTLEDMSTTNKAVVKLRKAFPKVPIIVRAKDSQHQQRLESMFGELFNGFFRLFAILNSWCLECYSYTVVGFYIICRIYSDIINAIIILLNNYYLFQHHLYQITYMLSFHFCSSS